MGLYRYLIRRDRNTDIAKFMLLVHLRYLDTCVKSISDTGVKKNEFNNIPVATGVILTMSFLKIFT
jgi:hypothetical protein